jgi:hypothetical protein
MAMDHDIIQPFSSCYLRRAFRKLVNETESKEKTNVKEFWKKFNIKIAII